MNILIAVISFFTVSTVRQYSPRLLLIMWTAFCSGAYAIPPETQVNVGYTFDDNVTRAKDEGAKLADRSCSVNLTQPFIFPIAEHKQVLLSGTLGGEIFDLNLGLNHLTGIAQGELQYRSSAEFGSPTFALFTKIAVDQYQSSLRDGFRYSAGVSIKQDLTDRIRLLGAVAHNEHNGKNTVFDGRDNSARINLDYSTKYSDTLYLGGEYRRGDLVTSIPESLSTNNTTTYVLDDAFSGKDVYTFRFVGTTVLSSLGYNLKIGPRSALDFSWRQARSSANYISPSLSNASLKYVTNQYLAVYLMRF